MQELRQLIEDTFKDEAVRVNDFNFIAEEEWNNDESHEIDADGEKRDAYDEKKFQAFLSGKGGSFGITHILFNELVNRKVIEKGEYILNICW